jgi:hypothetical protein
MIRWLTASVCLLVGTSSFAQINEVGFDLASDSSLGIQSSFSATIGQSLVVNIVGNNWSASPEFAGLNLTFNSTLLSLQSAVIDAANFDFTYGNCNATGCASSTTNSGTLDQIDFGSFFTPPVTGNFEIATLTFTALGSGNDAAGLLLSADPLNPIIDSGSNTLPVAFGSAAVTVNSSVVPPVPEPPTATLVGIAALLGFGLYRRHLTRGGLLP